MNEEGTSRTALVTGGTRGIGRGVCELLKDRGYHVVAGYGGDSKKAGEFTDATGIPAYQWDVSDFDACQKAVSQITDDHGTITVLVNNAGITRDNITMRMKDEEWAAVIDVNLTAAFRLARACMRGMMKKRSGRIIGITSIVGVTGNGGQANYAAAKAGMIGMTKSIAQELATRGITANCIAPGFIESPMTDALTDKQKDGILANVPAGKLGTASDIAAAAVYLASDEASYMTGQTLHINGGMAMI
ncbi:MAG: 3-oxoacyl-[acyl-carrier-protein] reductase [Candidatus Marinimicrobia bacterium]|nr:3-oxoacyl-[acyl-carrier-protein] reductase [Candidatus Neomarinimicrobiota bacterium]